MARDDQARETRERLFSAARELLGNLTYDEIRVDEITRRAEVGRTTFYLHFESKAEVYREIAGVETEALIALVGRLGELDPDDETATLAYIDECASRFSTSRRYLEIAALSVSPYESSIWLAESNRTAVERSLESIRRLGADPVPGADAELALAITLLMQFMLIYATLGNEPPAGWKRGLATHLRLALERARRSA